MRAHDQSSIFSTGRKFHSDYGLLLELHGLTLVAHSYALLLDLIEVTLTWFTVARGMVSKLIFWTGLHTNTIRLIEWHHTAAA